MSQNFFDRAHLKALITSQQYEEANKYISSFFFMSGINIYYRNGLTSSFEQYAAHDAAKLIPKDYVAYHKKTEEYNARGYLQSGAFMQTEYVPTIDFSTDDYAFKSTNDIGLEVSHLNMAKPMTIYDKIEAIRDDYAEDLQFVYDHIKTVWANDNEDVYEWIMNFNACTLTGKRKLRKALYLPCDKERAGRGSILNFFNSILGRRMYKTSSIEEIQKYTKNFEGTCCINFDELPTDMGNYKSVADNLKSLITEPYFTCRSMHCNGYQQKNTFNIYITSNNNAILITQSNNDRYFIAKINTSKVGDRAYFTKLNKILKKKEVQKLFYEDMVIRFNEKCEDWNEDNMPDSEVKTEKLIESLPFFYKWLKEEFILKNRSMNMNTVDFFKEYYRKTKDKTSKIKIGKMLAQLQILPKMVKRDSKTYKYYIVEAEDMYNTYKANKWIDKNTDHIDWDEAFDDTPTESDDEDNTESDTEETKTNNDKPIKGVRKFLKRKEDTENPLDIVRMPLNQYQVKYSNKEHIDHMKQILSIDEKLAIMYAGHDECMKLQKKTKHTKTSEKVIIDLPSI